MFSTEWLRPLARASSNRAIFTPTTDPALIQFENTMSSSNRMYMMKVQLWYLMLTVSDGSAFATGVRS